MSMNLKRFALAAAAVSALSVGTLAATAIPAAAHEVCDRDGDDCWDYHPRYYDRDWDDWRRHERRERRAWEQRREWEEHRNREAYRRWYWNQRSYNPYPGYGGSSVWLNF